VLGKSKRPGKRSIYLKRSESKLCRDAEKEVTAYAPDTYNPTT
jgi:hypothetical protein